MLNGVRRVGICLVITGLLSSGCSQPPHVVTVEVTRVVQPTAPAPPTPFSATEAPPGLSTQPADPSPAPPPTQPPPTPTPIVVVVVPIEGDPIMSLTFPQYSPAATTSLDFKVEARFGQDAPDGTGIAEVIFQIYNGSGDTVYQRIERLPGFCAFGGGEPACPPWVFSEHNSKWPNGLPIENGPYEIEVTVRADPAFVDGGNDQWQSNRVPFNIQAPPPQPGLSAVIALPEPGDITLSDRAYFRVTAFDPAIGSSDGAGIDHVDMLIIENPSGQTVHEQTERAAGYCAFGGGEPDCNEWFYADNNFQWPNGRPIVSGTYILRAVVFAQSGQTATVETTVDIRLEE